MLSYGPLKAYKVPFSQVDKYYQNCLQEAVRNFLPLSLENLLFMLLFVRSEFLCEVPTSLKIIHF